MSGLEGHEEFRVMPSKSEDHILITVGSRRAIDYKLSEKSAMTVFFAPSHISLTTPVGFNRTTQMYVCVVNKTDLLVWSGEETHLEKVEVASKLQIAAVDLICLQDMTVGIVLENGDLQPVSYLLQKKGSSHHEKCPHAPSVISKTRVVTHNGVQHCVYVGLNDAVDVHRLAFDVLNECFELQLHVKSRKILDFSDADVVGDKLVGISKGGSVLSIFPLFDSGLDVKLEHTLGESYKATKVVGLNESHAAVFCSKPDGAVIKVVDVNFGTVASETEVKSATSNHMVAFDSKKLLFKVGPRVACWTLEDLPSGLADLVGKHEDASSPTFGNDCLPWRDLHDSDNPDWLGLIQDGNINDCVNLIDRSEGHLPDALKVALVEFLLEKSDDIDVMKKALRMPMSENGILQYLKYTEYRSAKKMISSIIKLLQETSTNDDAFIDQLLAWLDLVLNAHYTNFVVTKDNESKDVLIMCAELMEELDSSVNMLATVMSQMKMMKEKIAIRQAQVSNHIYSVEVVYL